MKDVDVKEAFNDYWKKHFEHLVLPINQKNEIKKVAFHAYHEGARRIQSELSSELSRTQQSEEELA